MEVSPATVSQYLTSQLPFPTYGLTEHDNKTLDQEGLGEFIFQKVMSSDFRRSRPDQDLIADIRSKIQYHLQENTAISFVAPFGAYKDWHSWSYPEPDWAEVFNLNYMCRYIAPIAAAYEPGVMLQYSYGDDVMDVVSNLPPVDTARYMELFRNLVAFYQSQTPTNVVLRCVRINDFYTPEEYRLELRRNYEDNIAHWTSKFSEEERQKRIDSARRNLMPNGVEDLIGLTAEEWEDRILKAAAWCAAHDGMTKRRGFNKYSHHIQVGNVRGPRLELHVGSCDTSAHHFWVGMGIVEVRRDRFLQRIISQDKLNALFEAYGTNGLIERWNVETPFSGYSKNFGAICVWRQDLMDQ